MRQIGRIIVNAMLLLAMAAGEAAAGPLEDGGRLSTRRMSDSCATLGAAG
jgi:hypothetical protein